MKHFLRFGTVFTILTIGFSLNAFAKTTDDVTMGSIQNDLLEYLEVNHPEIEFGSKEYVNYVTSVASTNSDPDLANLENYDDIKFYCGEYLRELDEQQITMNLQVDDIFIPSEDFDSTTIGEIKEMVQEQDILDEIQYQELKSHRPEMSRARYDADEAASYAKKYALRDNISFPRYFKDCTNFVSQCVFAGGIEMDYPYDIPGGTDKTTKYWYCLPAGASWKDTSSWVGVEDFYEYCINEANAERHVYASLSALKQGVEIGDVVQLKTTDGGWYHSIFISDYDKDEGYLYCGHAEDRLDKPIDNLDPDGKYRVIRF